MATNAHAPIELQAINDIIEDVGDLSAERTPPNSGMILRPERSPNVRNTEQKQRGTTRRNRYKAEMQRACTAKDLREIMIKAVADAKLGDKEARKCVLEYMVGKPGSIEGDRGPSVGSLQIALFGENVPRMSKR